ISWRDRLTVQRASVSVMRMKSGQRPADRPEGLSVIVPVHGGRLALLARLLSSLEGSAARMSEPWECLVVDGSPEPEASAVARLWAAFGWPRRFARVLWGATVNHSVRASAFEEVGGFEEDRWIVSGGEDAALGVRLADAGRRLVTCPEAMVFHGREHVGPLQMLTKYFM